MKKLVLENAHISAPGKLRFTMRNRFFTIVAVLLSANAVFAQDNAMFCMKSFFDDTTMIRVDLPGAIKADAKIISIDCGNNVVVYLDERKMLDTLLKGIKSSYGFERENSKAIIKLLRRFKNADTTSLRHYPSYLNYLISGQIKNGAAMVFNKKSNSVIPFLYHRLERVISTADRVYYLPDRTRIFQVTEWRGILPNELMPDYE